MLTLIKSGNTEEQRENVKKEWEDSKLSYTITELKAEFKEQALHNDVKWGKGMEEQREKDEVRMKIQKTSDKKI